MSSRLRTLVTPGALPSPAPALPTRRHASFGASAFRRLLPTSLTSTRSSTPSTPAAAKVESGQGLYDLAVLDEEVVERGEAKKSSFHKTSTANFKTSRRKLNDLGRLIAGRGVDEGVLQLKVSPKKPASRLLSMLALARDHAIAKGLNRDKLVIAQAWTTQGPSLKRLDIKGRGRRGIKHHPSSKLHVLLAEGKTHEEQRRERKREGWRMSCRGLSEGDGVGIGRSRPIINVGVGGWKW